MSTSDHRSCGDAMRWPHVDAGQKADDAGGEPSAGATATVILFPGRPPAHCQQPGDCIAADLAAGLDCLCSIPAGLHDATIGPSSPQAAGIWRQLLEMQDAGIITGRERLAFIAEITGPGGTVRAGLFYRLASERARRCLASQLRSGAR
jgi:hypothetical protein